VKLLNIANKFKMVPILNMYIVWVYVEQGKSLDSKMWSYFLKTSPWVAPMHSSKRLCSRRRCSLHRGYFFTESHGCLTLGEFDGRERPFRMPKRCRQLSPSLRAEVRTLSAKVLCTVSQAFAESGTWCSRRRGSTPRARPLALGEPSGSRWRLCFR
jgi:hypothetical protein